MLRIHSSHDGFTLVEVVAVLLVIGILAAYATSKFNTGNVDSVVDQSVIKDVARQTQMRAMADIPGAGWSISVDGPNKTVLIRKNGTTIQSYSTNSYTGAFVISFDNMGQPTVSITSGVLPFTFINGNYIDPVTGYIE